VMVKANITPNQKPIFITFSYLGVELTLI